MAYWAWLAALVLGGLLGVFLVAYLTVAPRQMVLYVVLACLTGIALLALWILAPQGTDRLAVIVLSLAMVVAGWAAMSYRVLSASDTRPLPPLTRARGDPGAGHTAVIYLTHGEPETYNPMPWLNTFRELDKDRVPFVPKLARPFFLWELRRAYLRVGKSNHRSTHMRMLQSLADTYRAEGDVTTRFYLAFLDDDPQPDVVTIQALNEGASKIVVALVFLTVSNHTAEGLAMVERAGADLFGVPVRATDPLWNSGTLQSMFLERANRSIGATDKAKVGVMLVGHGQPAEWDVHFPTETQQEAQFRSEILRQFEDDGYRPENLASAWMSFKEPEPGPLVEAMARDGLEKIIYYSAAISADSLHSQYDVPRLVNEARIRPGLPVVNLGAWNDDPLVIRAIKERIDQQLA